MPVTGANPRHWNRPIAFGPYRTGVVQDRGTTGWSVEAINAGRVWIPGAAEADPAALPAALAALLLFQPPE